MDRELEELREYKMIFHWCKDHYDDIYNKYNNEWIAVKLPPKIYHNKDLDILLDILKKNNIDTSNTFIEFIKDKDIEYI